MDWDTLWINLRLATMDAARNAPYGAVDGVGALAIKDGRIAWLGPQAELPSFDAAAVTVAHRVPVDDRAVGRLGDRGREPPGRVRQ